MTNEELNTKVYEKLADAQQKFKEWLVTQLPEEILNHAYEYTIRADIVMAMEELELTGEQAKALLSSLAPLDEIYSFFKNLETDHMNIIRDCIEIRANNLIQDQRKTLLELAVYKQSAAYAKEHGELEQYRTSHRANVDCKNAIEDAIRTNYKDNLLDGATASAQVGEKFGTERMTFVLAATVQDKSWDGRISEQNKAWADTIPVPENPNAWGDDRNREFMAGQVHPGLLDMLVTHVRKEQAREKDTPEKRLSVLSKLQKPEVSEKTKSPAKKHKEPEL